MKIIKSIPSENIYFDEKIIKAGNAPQNTEMCIVNVFDEIEYQSVLGFGGAFTESAAYLYSLLNDKQKKRFMESYFSRKRGIGYNFGRTHINSCDFSLDIYTYIEEGDTELKTFNIDRDRKYIIPFIKDAMQYCSDELVLFASPWSPPAFMKDNESSVKGGSLKEEYKEVWARYYAKYIKAMSEEGITISAITVQNEPIAKQTWESCYYSPEDEKEFIVKYLAPVLEREGLSQIKIIIWDHNKERVYDRSKKIFASEEVKNRVWGVGHHWYSGDHFDGMRLVHEQFGKVLISTENCGVISDNVYCLAERYGKEIIGNFGNFTSAFCDWNLLLSENGGPFHNRSAETTAVAGVVFEDKSSGCYAPILFDTEKKELIFTPIYYYVGHFSKYVRLGAKRIATTKYSEYIHTIAFKNADNSIVLVVMNTADQTLPAVVRHNDVCTSLELKPHSIITVIL
ncbi:MAG: glycoside hydrolase family 30 beta sandwich domain-containing protein [Acutalibacteraceae bacterium]|nr:glycoside hydrolase family 30 beta sandwich domain-containing protein [Acutalibacteraceae bacterium]